MTIAFWCVLIAGLLPYAATLTAKLGAPFDNHRPREWLLAQGGWRARANAAQLNGFEAFPLFAAAVLSAHLIHGPQSRVDLLALAFIGCRLVYFGAYLGDAASLRSLAWLAGIACAVAIFIVGN